MTISVLAQRSCRIPLRPVPSLLRSAPKPCPRPNMLPTRHRTCRTRTSQPRGRLWARQEIVFTVSRPRALVATSRLITAATPAMFAQPGAAHELLNRSPADRRARVREASGDHLANASGSSSFANSRHPTEAIPRVEILPRSALKYGYRADNGPYIILPSASIAGRARRTRTATAVGYLAPCDGTLLILIATAERPTSARRP